jgi:hypothetical protein
VTEVSVDTHPAISNAIRSKINRFIRSSTLQN